jgi:hypothetical protein
MIFEPANAISVETIRELRSDSFDGLFSLGLHLSQGTC